MKHLFTPVVILSAIILMAPPLTSSKIYAQKNDEKSKRGDNQVKLYSDAVEVVEISDKVDRCSISAGATILRLRVKSATLIDVRLYTRSQQGR